MPALATVDDVRARDVLNDLIDVPDGFIQCVLDDEAACIIGDLWGEKRVSGESLVAGHIALEALEGSGGPSGPVVSESAGGLSRSYASPGGLSRGDGQWSTTTFGLRYLRLRATLGSSPAVLGGC